MATLGDILKYVYINHNMMCQLGHVWINTLLYKHVCSRYMHYSFHVDKMSRELLSPKITFKRDSPTHLFTPTPTYKLPSASLEQG